MASTNISMEYSQYLLNSYCAHDFELDSGKGNKDNPLEHSPDDYEIPWKNIKLTESNPVR